MHGEQEREHLLQNLGWKSQRQDGRCCQRWQKMTELRLCETSRSKLVGGQPASGDSDQQQHQQEYSQRG